MCKIASVSAVNHKNRDAAWAMMIALGDIMSRTQRDGLGYAAFDSKGNIFGERWLENDLSFTDFSVNPKLTAAKIDKVYNYFGDKVLRDDAQAIILHTRMATCGRGLKNTHPFVNDEKNVKTAIIHNGVIANDQDFEKKFSTCDSEVLVHLYEQFKVGESLKNIKEMIQPLIGWYTVMNLTKDPSGRMIMDIYTDGVRLSSYFVDELGTRVYSTSATDIEEAASILGFTIRDRQTVLPDMAYRIDVLTGKLLEQTSFAETRPPRRSGRVVIASGNFDDKNFANRWLKRITDHGEV